LVAKRRIEDSAAGFRQLLELLAEHTQRSDSAILIAMETVKGTAPGDAGGSGLSTVPGNPLAMSRYLDLMWNLGSVKD
jgi:hypothetical protein